MNLSFLSMFFFISFCGFSQNGKLYLDSCRASFILSKAVIDTMPISLNRKGWKLNLSQKESQKIAQIILYSIYGKKEIINEKPFNSYKIGELFVLWGNLPKNFKGGVFEIIIHRQNSQVLYINHEK